MVMDKLFFTSEETCEILCINKNQLTDLLHRGFIIPTLISQKKHIFSKDQIFECYSLMRERDLTKKEASVKASDV